MFNIKCTILGESGVGKTSIIRTYFENSFVEKHEITLGASFWNKQILYKNSKLDLQIWDTAGQERYRSLTPMYIRNSDFIILVYDSTNNNTLEKLNDWLNVVKKTCYNNLPKLIVIGNKEDLMPVNINGKIFANNISAKFYNTSAKKMKNIDKIFEYIIDESKLLYDSKTNKINTVPIIELDEVPNKSCCNIL